MDKERMKNLDRLVNVLNDVVNSEDPWREKAEQVRGAFSAVDMEHILEEFVSWFPPEENSE